MSAANPQGEAHGSASSSLFLSNTQKNRFQRTGFFVPEPLYSGAIRLDQAVLGHFLSIPTYSPSLALSWADILCD